MLAFLLFAAGLAGPDAPAIVAPAAPRATAGAPARAKANLASYVTDGDYPDSAIRAGEQGRVRFLLDVGVDGLVTGCTILESSGSPILDSTTCRIMRARARFTPARNSKGVPVRDRVSAAMRWVLPDPLPRSPEMDAAMQAWAGCLQPLVRQQLAAGVRSPQEIADKAFPDCLEQERSVAAVIAPLAPKSDGGPPSQTEDLRRSFVKFLERRMAAPKP